MRLSPAETYSARLHNVGPLHGETDRELPRGQILNLYPSFLSWREPRSRQIQYPVKKQGSVLPCFSLTQVACYPCYSHQSGAGTEYQSPGTTESVSKRFDQFHSCCHHVIRVFICYFQRSQGGKVETQTHQCYGGCLQVFLGGPGFEFA